ncbi:hypothetical protein OH76DRAFT_778545 [Lentinus brumalis]|uniref:Uncharacterized protein n=1 Tax=Lentinus brumalis TaxID=2498619 RepID=A0A371D4E9_9APHY|nr:hypothetical protein OH76DRAFT_778545 [Polyporus brumalis]
MAVLWMPPRNGWAGECECESSLPSVAHSTRACSSRTKYISCALLYMPVLPVSASPCPTTPVLTLPILGVDSPIPGAHNTISSAATGTLSRPGRRRGRHGAGMRRQLTTPASIGTAYKTPPTWEHTRLLAWSSTADVTALRISGRRTPSLFSEG